MKIININNSVARKVLAAVRPVLRGVKTVDNDYVKIEPYVNCREQGFALSMLYGKRKVAFSEDRHSDEIVVYYGTTDDFEFNSNIPSDSVYRYASFYSQKQIKLVVTDIVKYLTLSQ